MIRSDLAIACRDTYEVSNEKLASKNKVILIRLIYAFWVILFI
jgi:hypothetical protein